MVSNCVEEKNSPHRRMCLVFQGPTILGYACAVGESTLSTAVTRASVASNRNSTRSWTHF
jgi:hypothetical protein